MVFFSSVGGTMALWTVPEYTQSTARLCWEACARMMWDWRFKGLDRYAQKAGAYLTLDRGLTEPQMDVFYRQLGLRSLAAPKGKNLRFALAWTPVIFTDVGKATGHAMVLAGFMGRKYRVVNPCAVMSIDFEASTDVCASGLLSRTTSEVEKPLGKFMWYW
jgi:Papain-like cysteine protease AvrRpt2